MKQENDKVRPPKIEMIDPEKLLGILIQNGIQCFSDDCVFFDTRATFSCRIRGIGLRKGTCRFYNTKKARFDQGIPDRTDLPGETYNDFISQKKVKP